MELAQTRAIGDGLQFGVADIRFNEKEFFQIGQRTETLHALQVGVLLLQCQRFEAPKFCQQVAGFFEARFVLQKLIGYLGTHTELVRFDDVARFVGGERKTALL